MCLSLEVDSLRGMYFDMKTKQANEAKKSASVHCCARTSSSSKACTTLCAQMRGDCVCVCVCVCGWVDI